MDNKPAASGTGDEPNSPVSDQIKDQDNFDEDQDDDEAEDFDGDDEEFEDEDEYNSGVRSTIRAKWSMDGSATLTEAAEALRHLAGELLAMEAHGWQLTEPVNDDYGFIRRPPTPETQTATG